MGLLVGNQMPGWEKAVINANGATPVCAGPCLYGGYEILGNAGAHTMDIYDNVAASGQKVANAVSVGAAASKPLAVGWCMTVGLTVNLSGDPTDGLILVFFRPL